MAVGKMNLSILLDQLENLVETAGRVPLTGKVMIDADEVLDILDRIRGSLPEEVRRAEWIASEKERFMQDTQDEASRLLKQAEDYATKLIDESEIMQQARAEAKRMVQEAQARSHDLTVGASDYADRTLGDLAEQLERALKVVLRGRDDLRKSAPHTQAG
jgi:cell division septum initiation protein DivIVA